MRAINRLPAADVAQAKKGKLKPGMYADGGGLYLRVADTGAASWVYRFMLERQPRYMGLGSLANVSLADARDIVADKRKMRGNGVDPIQARDKEREQEKVKRARAQTFRQCAESYIKKHELEWRNEKHALQWTATLERYAYPVIGDFPCEDIDTALVKRVLEPIWLEIPETASRLRGRIEKILGAAATEGQREGANPARWSGHLENILPSPSKVAKVRHHSALPYDEIGAFMADLRDEEGIAAEALAFTILTAARTGETIGATWAEIKTEGEQELWEVPAERMKGGQAHRAPLSAAALAIIEKMAKLSPQQNGKPDPAAPIFPNTRGGKPLSNMAMLKLLHRMGRDDLTVHGFRSTFRDWAAESTNFPREVAEMALAHSIKGESESAYWRGDLFKKRRQLMDAWAKQCALGRKPAGNVVKMNKRA